MEETEKRLESSKDGGRAAWILERRETEAEKTRGDIYYQSTKEEEYWRDRQWGTKGAS